MKVRHLLMTAVLASLPLFGDIASAASIEVIETFDFPGAGKLTEPQKINDRGDIVGSVIDAATGASRGFYRGRYGHISGGFMEPDDTGAVTNARGINNARQICGNYSLGDGTSHGFFLAHRLFTGFDVPDTSSTLILGINNAGDFAGSEVENDGITQNGFVSLGGAITIFAIPDASATLAYQVNASNQIAGFYFDADGVTVHGFLRASDGTLTYPIDPEGSTGTILFGNNDSNWAVGRYTDAAGVTHGLFFVTPDEFVSFDYPGSTFTSLNGINAQGYITGRYVDAAGDEHGILAKVNLEGTSEPANTLPAAKTKPAQSAPARSVVVAPPM